jgi:DNA-binding MarR family transcriptional regulator
MPNARGKSRRKSPPDAAAFVDALVRLEQDIAQDAVPALRTYGLDFGLYTVLRQIGAGAVYPSAIAAVLRLPNSVITRRTDDLVAKDLLERLPDARDSRRVRLALTAQGRAAARDAARAVARIAQMRLEGVSPRVRAQLFAGVTRAAKTERGP